METLLWGLLIGALVGTSLGPVAFWGANVRKEGRARALVITVGGSIGDVLLAVLVLFARRVNDGQLLASFEKWIASPSGLWLKALTLVAIGVILLKMEVNGETSTHTKPRWRGLWACLGTLRPDTAVATWFAIAGFSSDSEPAPVLLLGFYFGALVMWWLSIESIYLVRRAATSVDDTLSHHGRRLAWVGHAIARLPLMRCIGLTCVGFGLLLTVSAY